jgi:hypothetical protein
MMRERSWLVKANNCSHSTSEGTSLSAGVCPALAFLAAVELSAQTGSAPNQSAIQANSNRVPAGKLENGVLTLHLELRQGDR